MENKSRRLFRILPTVTGVTLACSSFVASSTDLSFGMMEEIIMPMIIKSPSFKQDGDLPVRHTCDGLDISPMLEWSGVPEGTKSLALVVDDPDAPRMSWVHWVVYNIPADSKGLPETFTAEGLRSGTMQGLNDRQRSGYQGPCPPVGKHPYFFKLYALDIVLPDLNRPSKVVLEKAMHGHILGSSELIGQYQRK